MARSGKPEISRRDFVSGITGGSLIAGCNAATAGWTAAGDEMNATDLQKLPRLDGDLVFDEASRRAFAQDYGQIVHERPLAVLHPGSVQDIVRVIHFARRVGVKIVARGAGHQPYGQSQLRGGIIIDMRSLQSVHDVSDHHIEMDAGAQWRGVVRAASTHGKTVPVLANYPSLTVGGTLSSGGVGMASFRKGAQVDQILSLEVVTGEGEVVSCSESERRDLFEAALAGQGQCVVITRARMRLMNAPDTVREFMLPYADLQTLANDALQVIQDERFDGVVGLLVPSPAGWTFILNAIREFNESASLDDATLLAGLRYQPGAVQQRDVSYLEYVNTVPVFDPEKFHADLGLFIPGSTALDFIGEMLPRLTETDLGTAKMRMFFWNRRFFTRPLLRLPQEGICVYAGILRGETSDRQALRRMLAGNRTLFERNREIGGTLYPFAAVDMTARDWKRQYGSQWDALVAAKRRYDPDAVFASGPDLATEGGIA